MPALNFGEAETAESEESAVSVEPEAELVAKYEERYAQFKEIYPACKPLFDIIK